MNVCIILVCGFCEVVDVCTVWYWNLKLHFPLILDDSCSGGGAFRWVSSDGSVS
jgi:hypothetical protein